MTSQIHYIETALQKCEEVTRDLVKWSGILPVAETGKAVVGMQDHVEELIRHVWREYREQEPVVQQSQLAEFTVKPDKKTAKIIRKTQLALDFIRQTDPEKADKYTAQLASILNPAPVSPAPHFDPMFLKDYYRLMTEKDYRERRKAAWEQYLPPQDSSTAVYRR